MRIVSTFILEIAMKSMFSGKQKAALSTTGAGQVTSDSDRPGSQEYVNLLWSLWRKSDSRVERV